MKFFLASISLVLSFLGCDAQFSDAAKKTFVDLHNNIRSEVAKGVFKANGVLKPPAANMQKVEWDETLEKRAQASAESTASGHSNRTGTGIGENIWGGFSIGIPLDEKANSSFNSWAGEFQQFGWPSNYLSQSLFDTGIGHATILVWADNAKIGCGGHINNIGYAKVVCQYSYGNVINTTIYVEGEACTKCKRGFECEDSSGLCVVAQSTTTKPVTTTPATTTPSTTTPVTTTPSTTTPATTTPSTTTPVTTAPPTTTPITTTPPTTTPITTTPPTTTPITTTPSTTKPITCVEGWLEFQGNCYTQTPFLLWNQSEIWCNEKHPGSHLASIHSKEEARFIADTFSNDRGFLVTWVGLRRDCANTTWLWSDGSDFEFTFFRSGNPQGDYVKSCSTIWCFPGDYIGSGYEKGQIDNLWQCAEQPSNGTCKYSLTNNSPYVKFDLSC